MALIQITRKGLQPEWQFGEGVVAQSREEKTHGGDSYHYIKTVGQQEDGLLFEREVRRITVESLKGAVVSPVDDRWGGWQPGEYTVLYADNSGVRVKHPTRGIEGVFLYTLFKVVKPQPKPEFSLAEAQKGVALKFRSGCAVHFIAYVPGAKPHCQLVLLNPGTGNIVTRYANGRADDEPQEHANPGDILINRGDKK